MLTNSWLVQELPELGSKNMVNFKTIHIQSIFHHTFENVLKARKRFRHICLKVTDRRSSENLADLPYLSSSSCQRFMWITQSATYWGEQELCKGQSRDCILSFSSFISYDFSLFKGKKRGKIFNGIHWSEFDVCVFCHGVLYLFK